MSSFCDYLKSAIKLAEETPLQQVAEASLE